MITSLTELVEHIKMCIAQRPDLKAELMDTYEIARDEINDGESEAHECEIAEESIKEIMM